MMGGGILTNDQDAFNFATLSASLSLPVVTINVDENIGNLSFVYTQIAQQAFGLLPQKSILSDDFMRLIAKSPIALALKINDGLPINSNSRNVLDFENLVRSLTSHKRCKAIVFSTKPDNVPSEIGRNLTNVPAPKKM